MALMRPLRWLSLVLAWLLFVQSLAPALASLPLPPTEQSNRIGMDRQTLGTVGMGYGVTGVEHHQYLVDTSCQTACKSGSYASLVKLVELANGEQTRTAQPLQRTPVCRSVCCPFFKPSCTRDDRHREPINLPCECENASRDLADSPRDRCALSCDQ